MKTSMLNLIYVSVGLIALVLCSLAKAMPKSRKPLLGRGSLMVMRRTPLEIVKMGNLRIGPHL